MIGNLSILRPDWSAPAFTPAEVIGAVHEESIDGIDLLTVDMVYNPHGFRLTGDADTVGVGYRVVWNIDGEIREHTVSSISSHPEGDSSIITLTCESSMTELYKFFIEDRRPGTVDARTALESVLQGTPWEVGDVDETQELSINFYRMSVREAIAQICSEYGLDAWPSYDYDDTSFSDDNVMVPRYVNLGSRSFDDDRVVVLTRGVNLESLIRDTNPGDRYTALYGYGASLETDDGGWTRKIDFSSVNSGRSYVSALDLYHAGEITYSEYVSVIGRFAIYTSPIQSVNSFGAVEFPDCTDPSELLSLTKAALMAQWEAEPTYTAVASPGTVPPNVRPGAPARISWGRFARISSRVTSVRRDLRTGITEVTLGDEPKSYGDSYYNPNDIRSTDLKTAGTLLADRAMITAPGTAFVLENSGALQVRRDGTTGPFFPMVSQPTPTPGCSWSIGGGNDECLHFVYTDGEDWSEFTLNAAGGIILGDPTAGHNVDAVDSSGTRTFDIYDSSGNPVWRLYMSSSGNLARQEYKNGAWQTARYYRSDIMPGESLGLSGLITTGHLTNSKKSADVTVPFPRTLSSAVSSASVTGTITVRQNNLYLFGSTSSTPRNLSALTVSVLTVRSNGFITLRITGTEQINAINNNPVTVHFNTLTVTFS